MFDYHRDRGGCLSLHVYHEQTVHNFGVAFRACMFSRDEQIRMHAKFASPEVKL